MLTSKESHRKSGTGSRFTGKRIVMLAPKTSPKTISTQADKASLKFASFNDYRKGNEDYTKAFDETDGIVFEQLGIVVVNQCCPR